MVGFAENVAMNTVQPISAAVDQVIEQWIKNEEQRLNIVGEFDYSAVAVSQKGSELYFN